MPNLMHKLDRILNELFEEGTLLNLRLHNIIKKLKHLETVRLGHPFNGQLGVNDLKLRVNFLFTGTDSGRKLNKALAEGSKIVNTTGKAVGDALSQAKSSFTSFLSSWSSASASNNARSKHTDDSAGF